MKKVLFITYYWPPSGKASIHWPLKIIKRLPTFDWQPIVLTVEEDTFSQKDETFISEIPSGVNVIKAKSFEPFNIYKRFTGKGKDEQLIASQTISKENKSFSHRLSIWLRMNLFVPDARVGWYFPAVKAGLNLLKKEKSVLENSADIVFVTETMREDYVKKYPFIKEKSKVLYWGYSEEDFNLPPNTFPGEVKTVEVILHAGNIFDYQNPKHFWKTLKDEVERGRQLKMVFIGTVSPKIKQHIKNSGLDQYTEYKGFLPYKEMLKEMMTASYLLVCTTKPRHVPGKLFEYLRAGKPIIAFGDGNEEEKKILADANAGMMFSYTENGEKFFNGSDSFKTNQDFVKNFEMGKIADELSQILNKIII